MLDDFIVSNSSNLSLEVSVTRSLCEIINTPRSLAVAILLRYKEYDQIANLDIDPAHYNSYRRFADDYLVTSVLKKSRALPLSTDKEEAARLSFWQSERECGDTNARIYNASMPLPHEIRAARGHIRRILGPLNRRCLNEITERFRFGPGANVGFTAMGSVLSDKYDSEMSLTQSLYPYYRSLLGDRWWDAHRDPIIVEGNAFTTVPKNAKTNRGICKEPLLNSYVQLGIGAKIRDRLKRFGVDLTTQEVNQSFAKRAYKDGLATIDLSRASDSLAYSVVEELLPWDWFQLLVTARSPATKIDGETIYLEKFASMGNGYTFELETLIFYGVCLACVPLVEWNNITVYGDDIIVPQQYATRVIEVLKYLGFSTNTEKSFLAGNFFESCGTDWFQGQPVRPFYLRKDTSGIKDETSDIPYSVQIANALRHYARRVNHDHCCDDRFRSLWLQLFKLSPRAWRKCKVDATAGDVGFVVSSHEATLKTAKNGWQGWLQTYIVIQPLQIRKSTFGRLLYGLTQMGLIDKPTYGLEPRRGLFGGPVTKRSILFEWTMGYAWGERL